MSAGRVVGTLVSCAAVAGCAVVVVGMSRAGSGPRPDERAAEVSVVGPAATTAPARVEVAPVESTAPRLSSSPVTAPTTTAVPVSPNQRAATRPTPTGAAPAVTTAPAPSSSLPTIAPATTARPAPRTSTAPRTTARPAPRTRTAPRTTARPAPRTTTRPAPRPAARVAAKPAGSRLPLKYTTGNATRVVTVTAATSRSTRATVQAWTKLSNGRWKKYGTAVRGYVGSAGIGKAREGSSKTPRGSWTITQAFGRKANPGTKLPYFKTNPNDYWIGSPGRKYNTHQRCGSCGYNRSANERLHYIAPEYDYAAVIDYNTRNAPGGVKQGKGSAFFFHVSSGAPTAGCVAIPKSKLKPLLRWLRPANHPRILIGVT